MQSLLESSPPEYRQKSQIKAAVNIYLATEDDWNDQTVVGHTEELFDQLRNLMPLKFRSAKSQQEP